MRGDSPEKVSRDEVMAGGDESEDAIDLKFIVDFEISLCRKTKEN